ncbi:hypothetical protein D3C77_594340 [compost metagenome]
MAFQNDASAVAFQVLGVYVEGTHGFRLEVGAVVLEVEGGDCAQSSFFAHAAVNGTSVRTVASVRIDSARAFAGIVAALGGTANSDSHGQSQRGELTEFQHFHL